MASDARALVLRYYDALNRRASDVLDELVADDLLRHDVGASIGRAALKQTLESFCEGFPDLAHVVEAVIVEGDQVAVRTTTKGTHCGTFLGHPPTHRSFVAAAHTIYRVEDGVIREMWGLFDTVAMLQQLGLYAPVERPVPPSSGGGVDAPSKGSLSRSVSEKREHAPSRPASPAKTGAIRSLIAREARLLGARSALLGRAPRTPPGPLHELSLADVRADPLAFMRALADEYGDCVRYVCDGRETILLNRPDAARHVLNDHAANYTKQRTPDLRLLKPMLGDGLLTTDGAEWKRDRMWLQPLFARRQVERAADVMVDLAESMLERWTMRGGDSGPIEIVQEMSRLTLEIAARVILSMDLADQSEAFGQAVNVLNESMGHPQPGHPEVQQQFQPALAMIRRVAQQAFLARRFYDTGEDDLVASLLRAQRERGDSNRQLVDQAVTLLLAGHETTARGLSWAFALLDQHPAVMRRLVTEVDGSFQGRPSVTDLKTLEYTRAVIDEALRLYPPIWLMSRTALQDDEIAGYRIPAGTLVAISPYLLHRDPGLWENADRFVPERFLGERGESAAHAYHYLPFSHGPRQCIGKYFALLEMPLVMATICRRFELRSVPGYEIVPEALVTLRPRHGLPMTCTPRPQHAGHVVLQ